MTLEEFIINKKNTGEQLSKMERDILENINLIRTRYKTACKFIKSAGDMSRYDGNSVKDNDMVNKSIYYSNQKSNFEYEYPEIVLKRQK